MTLTAEFHQRFAAIAVRRAIEYLADPRDVTSRMAGELTSEELYPAMHGVALATIGALLDAMGYPEHDPSVGQRSWLDDDDEDEAS